MDIQAIDPRLPELTSYLTGMDMKTRFLMFLVIGVVLGLVMRRRRDNVVGSMICGIFGAMLFGSLCVMAVGTFYGVTGSFAFAFVGATMVLLIKRGFASDIL